MTLQNGTSKRARADLTKQNRENNKKKADTLRERERRKGVATGEIESAG